MTRRRTPIASAENILHHRVSRVTVSSSYALRHAACRMPCGAGGAGASRVVSRAPAVRFSPLYDLYVVGEACPEAEHTHAALSSKYSVRKSTRVVPSVPFNHQSSMFKVRSNKPECGNDERGVSARNLNKTLAGEGDRERSRHPISAIVKTHTAGVMRCQVSECHFTCSRFKIQVTPTGHCALTVRCAH